MSVVSPALSFVAKADAATMRASIRLVRHGPSAHLYDGRWMHADRVPDYERAYNDAGIMEHDVPPPSLVDIAMRADVVVASDVIRAIESARRLAPGRDPLIQPLLREIAMEPPGWMPIPLPISLWDALSFTRWSFRLFVGSKHESVHRANLAADWLVDLAREGASVVAVTHGGFRRIVGRQLEARGWRPYGGRLSYANWSSWTYSG